MKTSRLGILLVIGLFICSVTIVTTALAQGFPPGGGGKSGMARGPVGGLGPHGLLPVLRLNLSQDQQGDLLDILEKYQEMSMAYMDTMMVLDREMADIAAADNLDEESARAVFRKQAVVREEMMILEMKMNDEIEGVLSSEQLDLLKPPGAERPFPPQGG